MPVIHWGHWCHLNYLCGGASGALGPFCASSAIDALGPPVLFAVRTTCACGSHILADLESIREERSNVHADLEHIETAHEEAKGELHSCNAERLKMTLKVNELEKDLLAVKKEFGIFKII